jgi:uncharacterized protein YkwD
MNKPKLISYIIILIVLGAGAYFLPSYLQNKQDLVSKVKNRIQEIRNDTKEIIPEAKISAPLEQSEFEKTASYEEIDCKNFESNIFAEEMFKRINSDRVANGKKALKWNSSLCESAGLKSEDMDNNNYFEHNSPSGITPWYWIKKVGYNYTFVGENLALNYFTANSAHAALMNSPGHRANILNENFTEIGINYVRGKLNGEDAFFVVQHFASPGPEKPQIQYVCETDKANKNLKELKNSKNKIEKYLSDAEDKKDEFKKSGYDTKEINDYINDMENKEKEVNGYIKEIEDYLKKCKG